MVRVRATFVVGVFSGHSNRPLPNGLSLVMLTVGLMTGILDLNRPPLENPVASVLISDMVSRLSMLSRSVSQNTPLGTGAWKNKKKKYINQNP